MERDAGYTALLDRINSTTQLEREALRNAFMEGLGLKSSMDQLGFHIALEIQSGQNAKDQVEVTKVSLMLASANQHLDPFRNPDQRLNTQEARRYLDSLEKNVFRRFLQAVVDLEEKTLTVAEPFFAKIQPTLVGQQLLVELDRSHKLHPPQRSLT